MGVCRKIYTSQRSASREQDLPVPKPEQPVQRGGSRKKSKPQRKESDEEYFRNLPSEEYYYQIALGRKGYHY